MQLGTRIRRAAEVTIGLPAGMLAVRFPFEVGLLALVGILWFVPAIGLLAPAIIVRRLFAGFRLFGPITPTDLLLMVFVARWAAQRITMPLHRTVRPWSVVLLGFLAWAWFGLWQTGSVDTLNALARVTLYCFAFLAAADDERLLRPLLYTLAIYGTFEVLLAALGVTPHVGIRWYGAKNDPQQFAMLLLAALPAALILPKRFRWIVMGAAVTGLIFTLSRGIWLAASVELAALLLPWVRRRPVLAIAVGAVLILGGLQVQERLTERLSLNEQSLPLREQTFRDAVTLIQTHPLYGTGWAIGTISTQIPSVAAPYNLWLNIGASTGLLGVGLFTIFLAMLGGHLVRDERPEMVAVWIYLLGFLAISLGEMTIYADSPATVEFFLLTGAAAAHFVSGRQTARTREGSPVPVRAAIVS